MPAATTSCSLAFPNYFDNWTDGQPADPNATSYAKTLLDQLAWWAATLRTARAGTLTPKTDPEGHPFRTDRGVPRLAAELLALPGIDEPTLLKPDGTPDPDDGTWRPAGSAADPQSRKGTPRRGQKSPRSRCVIMTCTAECRRTHMYVCRGG